MTIKRILVPTDFSASSRAALNYAVELAAHFPAAVHVLHVVPMPRARPSAAESDHEARRVLRRLETADRRLRRSIPKFAGERLGVDRHLLVGDPADRIVDCARDAIADLIVMAGPTPRTGARPAGRRTCERVVQRAPCPVLTLPLLDGDDRRVAVSGDAAVSVNQRV